MDFPSTSSASSKPGDVKAAKMAGAKAPPKAAAPPKQKPAAAAPKAPRARSPKVSTASAAVATESDVPSELPTQKPMPEALQSMIATAAYYLAVQRNFAPGGEVDDWLEAERQIRAFYG